MIIKNLILTSMISALNFSNVCAEPEHQHCVYASISGEWITFTIHSAAKGWAAFGIGSKMVWFYLILFRQIH
jgi:hypothetical protein